MLRFINIMLEMVAPIFITFYVLPKVWNHIFDKKEKPKKLRQVGLPSYRNTPPPPPKPRKVGSTLIEEHKLLQKQLEQYEVRGGRIVKKEPTWEDELRFRRIRDGKMISGDEKYQNNFKEFGEVTKQETKKKHFTKGVDPDFL